MDPILETLLQTGGLAIIAYMLIQYQREQSVAHREELKALLVQTSVGQQEQSRRQRTELTNIIQNNTAALNRIAEKFNTLENSILELSQLATDGHNLAQLKEMLCSHDGATLSLSPSQKQKEEDNG
jgi:thiamine kinase-like enzyme